MKKLIVIFIVFMTVSIFAEEQTIKSIPVRFQGKHYMIAASQDEGENIDEFDPTYFCRITSNKITSYEKKSYKIIKLTKDEDDKIYVYLSIGHTWELSFPFEDKKDMIKIIDYNTETGQERNRIITLRRK